MRTRAGDAGMRRSRAPATMVHSLSCTDLDWERVRERADAAGLSMSRYLVGRALTVELPRDGDGKVRPPPRLVLEESEQRAMHDRIARIAERMSTGSDEEDRSQLFDMPRCVSFLFVKGMQEMVLDGRMREMTALLAKPYGEEYAARIAEGFLVWARENGWRIEGG